MKGKCEQVRTCRSGNVIPAPNVVKSNATVHPGYVIEFVSNAYHMIAFNT